MTSPEMVIGISRSATGATSAETVTTTGRPSWTTTAAEVRLTVGTGVSATAAASTTAATVLITAADWLSRSSPAVATAGPMRTETALTGPTTYPAGLPCRVTVTTSSASGAAPM